MLMLFDRDESFISSLKYNNIRRHREINGLNTLEFETNREVEFGQRLLFKDKQGNWHEYIIIDYFKAHDENGVTYEVFCEDSTSELYGFFIEDMKPRNALASNVLGQILEGTRFEVGYVDDFGKESFNIYRTSVKAALWKMLEKYKAEIKVRLVVGKQGIEHRYIDLRQSIGRNVGKTFTYKKDIGSIKKTTSTKDLVTALYGFGKGEEVVAEDGQPTGGYSRKIDFAEINGGKKYVADEEARKKYGLGKERVHIFGSVDFDDCEDRKELLDLTKEKLKELSKPKITYELNVEDISRYDGYIGEGVDLGDIVLVKDEMIDTLVQTRVIAIKDNPIEEVQDSEIVLGNFIKDLSDNMVAYDKLKSIFENDRNRFNDELERLANGVKSSYIQRVLEKFNKELNETGGWVYAEEGEGLLILNAPREGNPTQAINLKGGMIAIANHKNADGSFAYETFGDGNGFTANLIRAGVLRGGKVFFNLEDGTFLIGESRTKYSMYWDGTTLHLRDVDIDLSNNYQIQDINNQISNVDNKIQRASSSFDKGIQDLKNSVDLSIKRIDEDISSVDTKVDESNLGLEESISNVSSKVDDSIKDFGIKFETVDKKIDVVSQDFKLGQGKLESTINGKISGLANVVEGNQSDFESYKQNNVKIIGDIKSEIKQTAGSIESNVASQIKTVNDRIDSKDTAIRDYVKTNYSTISQTDEKIKSTVASEVKVINSDLLNNYDTKAEVDAKIKGADTSLKSYISTNYSTISQTDSKIDSKVASEIKGVNEIMESKDYSLRFHVSTNYSTKTQTSNLIESKVSSVTSDVSGLRSRVSSAESSIRQTANEVSSKVSKNGVISAINQSSEYVKIQASKIQLDGDVSLTGNFVSRSGGAISSLKNGSLRFEIETGTTLGSSIGLKKMPKSGSYMTVWAHDYYGALAIGSKERETINVEPYILFDRNGNAAELHSGLDHLLDEILINGHTSFYKYVNFDMAATFRGGINLKGEFKIGNWVIFEDSGGDLAFKNPSTGAYFFMKKDDSGYKSL